MFIKFTSPVKAPANEKMPLMPRGFYVSGKVKHENVMRIFTLIPDEKIENLLFALF